MYSPFPLLVLLDGQRENALEEKQQNRRAQIPVKGVFLENRHLPNTQKAVGRKNNSRKNRLDCGHKTHHRTPNSNSQRVLLRGAQPIRETVESGGCLNVSRPLHYRIDFKPSVISSRKYDFLW